MEQTYDRKNRARAEKKKDKELGIEGKCLVFTMDVEAVKVAPWVRASASFFKTKLTCHNFTVYNLVSRVVVCYWFDETASDMNSSTFASCIIKFLDNYCVQPYPGPIILWSDGCVYQNRNVNLSNALSNYAQEKNVEIIQKYLEVGHTQMECDSVHARIENTLKGREIYIPHDYVRYTELARKKPSPYVAEKLSFSDFKDFSAKKYQRYPTIRPGRIKNDPVVTDLRVLRYLPNGDIEYKVNFDKDYKLLPQRKKSEQFTSPVYPTLHRAALPIETRKWQHLQELKSVIPSEYHHYYDTLKFK